MRREERAESEEKESQNDAGREKAESAEGAGKVRGADEEGGSTPRILFVCVGNACRSPMAAGLARKMLNAEAESAESHHSGRVQQKKRWKSCESSGLTSPLISRSMSQRFCYKILTSSSH